MNKERVIQKFRKKQKHIKKSKKWGRKKIEEIRNSIFQNAVETIHSIFMSLGSKLSGLPGVATTISKPQTISKASLAFANRYKNLSKIYNHE